MAHTLRGRRVDRPGGEQGFPHGVVHGLQIFHREATRGLVLPEKGGNRAGHDFRGDPHPLRLPAAAFDGRSPFRRDLELRKSAFDANDDAGRQLDTVDIRRNTPGQGFYANRLVCAH